MLHVSHVKYVARQFCSELLDYSFRDQKVEFNKVISFKVAYPELHSLETRNETYIVMQHF